MSSGSGAELAQPHAVNQPLRATGGDEIGSLWGPGSGIAGDVPGDLDPGMLSGVAGLVASQLGMRLVFVAQLAASGDQFQILATQVTSPAASDALLRGELVLSPAMVARTVFIDQAQRLGEALAETLAAAFPGHQAFLSVPILDRRGEVAGMLGGADPGPKAFTPLEVDLGVRAAGLIRLDRAAAAAPATYGATGGNGDASQAVGSDQIATIVSRVLRSGQPETISLDLEPVEEAENFEIRLLMQDDGDAVTLVRDEVHEVDLVTALRVEPGLLQSLMDLLPEQIYVKDIESRFVRVNQTLVNDFGFADASEMIGKTDFDLFVEPVARAFREREQELFRSGEPIVNDLERQPRPNRIDHWRRTFKVPIRDRTGSVVGLIGSSWDISEGFEQQQALRWLASLVNWSTDAIIGLDGDGNISSWNPAAARLFGYSLNEIVGRPYVSLVPDGAPMIQIDSLIENHDPDYSGALETVRRRKDGSLAEVELRAAVVRNELGEANGVSVIMREIGQRKAAERRLRELELRYRTFIEQMPALTYLAKPDATLMMAPLIETGPRFESMLGYPIQAWLDDPRLIFSLIHPDDRDLVEALDAKTNRTGEPFLAEYRLVAADGQDRWVRDESVPIRDDEGNLLYWLGFIVDISDLKRTEVDLIEALDGQREANLELERVNQAKSEIVSMISHEFRTPLTSIQGFSELLADETLTAQEVRGFAATINVNARRLARMIHDMLDLDRLESGQTAMRREPVDLNQVASDVVELLGLTAPSHAFALDFEPRLPLVTGDVDLLVRVVMNLVGNAIKYSGPGSTVTITTQAADEAVTLRIQDEGIGIPESEREAIFKRYSRIERAEQRHIEGTGLGLPIARQIVELHHGAVWAEIPDGGGSVFHVVLPVLGPDAAG